LGALGGHPSALVSWLVRHCVSSPIRPDLGLAARVDLSAVSSCQILNLSLLPVARFHECRDPVPRHTVQIHPATGASSVGPNRSLPALYTRNGADFEALDGLLDVIVV